MTTMEREREDRHHFKTAGAASRFSLYTFLVALLVVAGVKVYRAGGRSLMGGSPLAVDANDPFWELFWLIFAYAIGIGVPVAVISWKRRRACTDFTKAFANKMPPPKADVSSGALLVPDASVSEVAELSKKFEAQGIRFEVRQTYIDNAFHWRFGNGGLGTRMCVYVHPDDCAAARPIADVVLGAT